MNTVPKILYIDDEPENLVGFKISFSKNFTIYTAENTRDGYELLKSMEFSVVMVDYKMPEEDGISFIERIKLEFSMVVFIVISGFADLDIVIKAINMNCLYSFVQKPWNYNELKIVINNAVAVYEMKKENKALIEKLVINNRQLEESIDREKKLNDLKDVFLQNISHEIRTPLNGIIGFANLALEESDKNKQKSCINICLSSGYQLLKIIEDMVAASMIITKQAKTCIEEFNLKSLMDDLMYVRNLRGLNNTTIDFFNEIDTNIQIINDKDKIFTVIDSIIDNADKFTKNGFIKVSAYQSSEEEVIISIQDTGIGIEKHKIPIIFETFRQADESNIREYGGNGLGLFIAKSYVEMLGGSIWCESELNKGSVFFFSIKKIWSESFNNAPLLPFSNR
jgi:signal transduction histidine kinase